MANKKPNLSFWQIWNMSFGFLGIQFGFALQGGFMSNIFTTLGADKSEIPLLLLAAPLLGLLVQPVVGYMSDRTWHKTLGRRRPFILVGAILASIALFFMPYSPTVWIAVGTLILLDGAINISMEPFRAFVADITNESQRTYAFVVQTLIIGIGTWVASSLPLILTWFGVNSEAAQGVLPTSTKVAFAIGAVVFIIAILYTIFTTKENPPEDMEAFLQEREESKGLGNAFEEISQSIIDMPDIMKRLGVVQFFSWFAFFTMWAMYNLAVTEHIWGVTESANPQAYQDASQLAGSYMGTYGLTSMLFALILVFISSKFRVNRKYVHMVSLFIGAIGFFSMYFIEDHRMLHFSFGCIGIAWASILSMPFAMLSSSIDPKKLGLFMGLFNMFICIPQIIASLGGINLVYLFGEGTINTMLLAGVCLVLAGLSNLLITDPKAIK